MVLGKKSFRTRKDTPWSDLKKRRLGLVLQIDLGRPCRDDEQLVLWLRDADDPYRVGVATASTPACHDDDQRPDRQQLVLVSHLHHTTHHHR